jgi:hypothetical protein
MHKPYECELVTEIGITGKTRGRRQWFTGKPIMQVEVVLEVKKIAGTQIAGRRYKTMWRDATLAESFQVQHNVGFIVKPDDEVYEVRRPSPPPSPPCASRVHDRGTPC